MSTSGAAKPHVGDIVDYVYIPLVQETPFSTEKKGLGLRAYIRFGFIGFRGFSEFIGLVGYAGVVGFIGLRASTLNPKP